MVNARKGGKRQAEENNAPAGQGEGVKYSPRPWMREYGKWFEKEFGKKPPEVVETADPETGSPAFTCRMGYTSHTRPTENLLLTIRGIRQRIPREKFFKFTIEGGPGERMEVSYMDNFLDAASQIGFLTEGKRLKVMAHGDIGEDEKRRAGWIISNILSDKSFDYEFGMPIVDKKKRKLLDMMPYGK